MRLKEITEYYPQSKNIKNHYFVIKPDKEVYHGAFEVYDPNGQLAERGYFDHGVKTFFIKFNSKGKVLKELLDSVLTINMYFSNGELQSTKIIKNEEPFGTWKRYHLNKCDKPFLISSTEYFEKEILCKKESINNIFMGVFSLNSLVTQDSFGNIDTTQVIVYCDVIYPPKALKKRIEGTLFVKINLSIDCQFNYEFLNELGYGVEDQLIDKLELVKEYLLIKQNCQDVEMTIPIKFEIIN